MRGKSPMEDGDDDSVLAEEAMALFVDHQVRYTQIVNIAGIACWMGRQCTLYLEMSRGLSTWSGVGLISMVTLFVISVTGVVLPRCFNARTIVLWHMLYMLVLGISCSPIGIQEDEVGYAMIVTRPLFHVAAVVIGLGYPRLCMLAFTNACFSLCHIFAYTPAFSDAAAVGWDDFVLGEVVIFGGKFCLFAALRLVLQENAMKEASARMGQCERSAVSSLLGMVCDAVVDVDSRLRMREHVPSLANMLMHGVGKSLRHVSLREFLDDGEDAEAFEGNIETNARGQEGSPTVGMFGGHVRDAMHNRIRVIFYDVPYRTFGGRLRHLIGLREDTDFERAGADSDSCMPSASATSPGLPPRRHTGRFALPPATLSDEALARLAAIPAEPPREVHQSSGHSNVTPGEETMTADVLVDEELTIRYATQQLRDAFGLHEEGGRFAELLSRADSQALLAWIREGVELVRSQAVAAPLIAKYQKLHMRFAGSSAMESKPRMIRVCFPALREDEPYLVSINVNRHRGPAPGPLATPTRGTAPARAEPQELAPGGGNSVVPMLLPL